MEEPSSTKEEGMEVFTERTATFYLHHPCCFLVEALGCLLKCLGFEIGTSSRRKHGNCVDKTSPADSEEVPLITGNTACNCHKSCAEDSSDQEDSTSTQSFVSVPFFSIKSHNT